MLKCSQMEFVCDLHLHSKYSRAVSKDMTLPNMAVWAAKKGLKIISTGDWTHPIWIREIKNELEEASHGLFKLKNSDNPTLFLLSVEISSIYTQGGKVRRIHNLIFSPSIETCEKINAELLKRGCNLGSDGRPIIGLSSETLAELVFNIDDKAMLIPCHAWTPWFSLYGSMSGFDSINDCYGAYADRIYGVETGLSSDPYMNWQIKELEDRSILSFSDAHSPAKMGREATVFVLKNLDPKFKISYEDIRLAIMKEKSAKLKIGYTIEFYPEEGKYHYDGHRNCSFVQTPDKTKQNQICPVCKKQITVGVMYRVLQLAKDGFAKESFKISEKGLKWIIDPTKNQPPFVKLVPLNEIIAESFSSTVASQKVKDAYENLCKEFGTELNILLKTPIADIENIAGEKTAEAVEKVRTGNIVINPGFDGQYGVVKIWGDKAKKENNISSQLGIDF